MANFATSIDLNDPFLKVPLVKAARECDGMIMKANFLAEYTVLFASHFMSNPLVYQAESIANEGKFTGASDGECTIFWLICLFFFPFVALNPLSEITAIAEPATTRQGCELRFSQRRC